MQTRGPIMLLMTSRIFRRCVVAAMMPAFYLESYYLLLERKLCWPTGVDPATGQNLYDCLPRVAPTTAPGKVVGVAKRQEASSFGWLPGTPLPATEE